MAVEYGSNVEKFVQNAAGILRMYFKRIWRITRHTSRMYKNMTGLLRDWLQNVAESSIFVSLDTTAGSLHVNDVALLQIAVIQSWWEKMWRRLEKRTRKPKIY